ncbi:high affinity glucose transporter, partial [Kluyveromyces marxianus]
TGSYVPQLPVVEDEEGNKLGLLGNPQHLEDVNSTEKGLMDKSSSNLDFNSQSNNSNSNSN